MADVLLVWELGSGLGHLERLSPLARCLRERGHRVTVALRRLERAAAYFPDCRWLQAPLASQPPQAIREPANLAEILVNQGATEPARLAALAGAWRTLLELVAPRLVVLDYSPLALLASQGLPARRVSLGTGFVNPPPLDPLPDLRPTSGYPDRLRLNETRVRDTLNGYLHRHSESPLPSLAALFRRVDAELLTSYPELDHFPEREGGDYVGTWNADQGEAPVWPAGEGPRLFAYLKPFPGLAALLRGLAARGNPTLVYCEHPGAVQASTGSLRVVNRPLHLATVAGDCAVALTHAGHGTVARLLLAGVPLVMAPLQMEQYRLAERVEALGAGLRVTPEPDMVLAALNRLLAEPGFGAAARAFATRHGAVDEQTRLARVVARLVDHLN